MEPDVLVVAVVTVRIRGSNRCGEFKAKYVGFRLRSAHYVSLSIWIKNESRDERYIWKGRYVMKSLKYDIAFYDTLNRN